MSSCLGRYFFVNPQFFGNGLQLSVNDLVTLNVPEQTSFFPTLCPFFQKFFRRYRHRNLYRFRFTVPVLHTVVSQHIIVYLLDTEHTCIRNVHARETHEKEEGQGQLKLFRQCSLIV